MKFFFLFAIILSFAIYSCSKKKEQHATIIEGYISNLPDGVLYVYEDDSSNRIDSVTTKNGKFHLNHKWNIKNNSSYLGLDHKDKNGITRSFSFPTHANYKGAPWESQFFMSDSRILINGTLKDFNPKGMMLQSKYKLVSSPSIISGKQTDALYNIDTDLFEGKTTNDKINLIQEKIKKYPYSYHLLFQIEKNKNNFTPDQLQTFLLSFQQDVINSLTYKQLLTYNKKIFNQENIKLPLLVDDKGNKTNILNPAYKTHLIIFWASWCGPCRKEIPLLKKNYTRKNHSIEFISISIDSNRNSWYKALKDENMTWKQLIITQENENSTYEDLQIKFKLNKAIPYTVMVDNKMNILFQSTGLSSEKEIENMILK
ncbi:AhpC/TSA family protein [Chryseobacterium paridis]|uniref:AhpC/TSA family protein n=1 Tax=Chryseobacterium paridis TaxID=2800328 RepID=A0ABS1FUM8_9FLAO|nr:AhpC/TSA family protein [Chryseobacterium paridis]MBK1896139.1 AhpC/TSA family protein [Chryseobacterium paridis]